MYKTLMIVNLEAGKGNFEKKLSFIVMELRNNGFDITIKYTENDFGADKIIENYKMKYDLLIVCGGDGTLNQVVNALTDFKIKVSLAFIPIGTTNDFAKTLNLPKNGLTIAQNIINSKALKVDTGIFNQKYFNYIVAFGAFTEVSYNTNKKQKRRFGRLAYIFRGLKQIKNIIPYKTKLYFDNETIEDEFIYGSISNSLSIGGLKCFRTEEINLCDGKFEVLLIKKPKHLIGYLGIIKAILTKDYSKDRNILFSQDSSLKIEFQEMVDWTIDGEKAGIYQKVEFGVINQNIEFLIM